MTLQEIDAMEAKRAQDTEERAYILGRRAGQVSILNRLVQELGYNGPEATQANWILEREAAIASLREICKKFGDDDWPDNLHLADILEKHLADHLYE